MATVDAMKLANKEMKKQYKGIDIDKIEVRFLRFPLPPRSPFLFLSRFVLRADLPFDFRIAELLEHSLRHGGPDRSSE